MAETNQKPLVIIKNALESKEVSHQLAMALNKNPDDESSFNEVRKYANSVFMEIKRSEGSGNYTDLTTATPDSIVAAMIDAANFQMQIDGRKLCYLEKRGNKVALQIGTNGFVAKIKEQYPDASFATTPIFKGDTPPKITEVNGQKSCEFTSTNPFGKVEDLLGILVVIEYTNQGGKLIRDVQPVPIDDLRKMQAQSKSTAWGQYTIERMKTAALKRATKWHFRQNATIQKLVEYDNQDYNLNEPATPMRKSIIDNINEGSTPEEVIEEKPSQADVVYEAEFEQYSEPAHDNAEQIELLSAGDEASSKGVDDYKAWVTNLTDQQKDLVRHMHAEWQETARQVSRKKIEDTDAPQI